MPRGDGSGPRGMGSRTGRSVGYCTGFGMPGYANAAFGRGAGPRGYGFGSGGYGFRNRLHAAGLPGFRRFVGNAAPPGFPTPFQHPDPALERQALKSRAEALEAELALINKQLSEVEAGSPGD